MTTTTTPDRSDGPAMAEGARVQLALRVTDVDAAVAFYRHLFGVEPAKRRPGYANFAIASPPLKLVLIEGEDGGSLDHLGVEVPSAADVTDAVARIESEGLPQLTEEGVRCCYAVQDKTWVTDPDGARWEVYTVLGDSDVMAASADAACCA